jgi:hypothetical protein
MRFVLVCAACGSAVVLVRLKYGGPGAVRPQEETPSHCSNRNCPNSSKRTKPAADWYRRASLDRDPRADHAPRTFQMLASLTYTPPRPLPEGPPRVSVPCKTLAGGIPQGKLLKGLSAAKPPAPSPETPGAGFGVNSRKAPHELRRGRCCRQVHANSTSVGGPP